MIFGNDCHGCPKADNITHLLQFTLSHTPRTHAHILCVLQFVKFMLNYLQIFLALNTLIVYREIGEGSGKYMFTKMLQPIPTGITYHQPYTNTNAPANTSKNASAEHKHICGHKYMPVCGHKHNASTSVT